ncbi:hypothetical protein VSU01S_39220 [Vibrio superstes NBRC 103154]|uniref:Uncharacterized protein n=1 Tax=Vibrio superstes NBRC 103154 TaxID=1219062 RepID=A0A511QXG0_9VIBR|nr:hypothetical protein VSU01S_39220 [Vibrio superstes NBRC 103154]
MMVGEEGFDATGLPDPDSILIYILNYRCKKAPLFRVGLRMMVGEQGFDATGLPDPDSMHF